MEKGVKRTQTAAIGGGGGLLHLWSDNSYTMRQVSAMKLCYMRCGRGADYVVMGVRPAEWGTPLMVRRSRNPSWRGADGPADTPSPRP